ncbi:hypothetical protein D6853_11195 [Butyrivibrio sp. X503]|uniref:hypothetical protein n=1 Tax=Butyrivibrio sp. X503 TaxID=2364878 RepID=UPI000EA8AECF|nr:hypothetical protein [Butyrivibrio sp. X503]RKM55277.1 hypothetical protein D6853_11195 [Butyrivibrio sp. X503]
MKTKYLLTIPALMLVLSGCDSEVSSIAPSVDSTEAVAASTQATSESSTAAAESTSEAAESENSATEASSEVSSTEASSEATSAETSSDAASVSSEYSSGSGYQNNPKDRKEVKIDDDSAALYDSFLEGTAKATYSSKGDKCEYLNFSSVLDDGKNYTLKEMLSNIAAGEILDSPIACNNISAKYLDLGLDGKIEMLILPEFEGEFQPSIVVKNVGSSLKVCFVADSWSRSTTMIGFNGSVSSTGSGGATSHGGDEGYLDASGEYHFWHRCWEELYGERDNDNKLSFRLDGEDPEYNIDGADLMYVVRYDLDESQNDKGAFYMIYLTDSDYNDIEDDPSNPNNPYDAARDILVKEKGLKVVSEKEEADLLAKARKKIGFSDEVYKFGE